MWVLEPIAVAPATQQPQQPPAPLLLVGSEVSVGRPLKKGSTVGKANVLIFNEQSVSSIHAKLQIQPASSSNEAEGGFQHGAISITGVLFACALLSRVLLPLWLSRMPACMQPYTLTCPPHHAAACHAQTSAATART